VLAGTGAYCNNKLWFILIHFLIAYGDAGGGTGSYLGRKLRQPTFTISSGNADANGYGNFEYAVPSGYYALNTKNLAEYG
jgi:hypothetical protein